MYKGTIIEESLENKDILKKIRITSTEVEAVTEKHATPWLSRWTLHTIEISENQAQEIAEELGRALEREHPWYADFKSDTGHYIIFRNKIFFVDRKNQTEYDAVRDYGVSLGIPKHQVDFQAISNSRE